jgi:hypothetical protein
VLQGAGADAVVLWPATNAAAPTRAVTAAVYNIVSGCNKPEVPRGTIARPLLAQG